MSKENLEKEEKKKLVETRLIQEILEETLEETKKKTKEFLKQFQGKFFRILLKMHLVKCVLKKFLEILVPIFLTNPILQGSDFSLRRSNESISYQNLSM